jgi:DUF1365 family protein
MESALYFGSVRHRRFGSRPRSFRYPLFQLYADLGELDRLFVGSWLASTRRPAWAWLRRRDHFGDPRRPWPESVRDEIERSLGRRPGGAIRLLTHPRTLGFRMNPVSFFYAFDESGALDSIVAEVTNTPWDERHLYVRDARREEGRGEARVVDRTFPKRFHVSPFFPMELTYRWRLTAPAKRLAVQMESFEGGRKLFDATLRLERRPLDSANLRRALVAYPAMTLKVFLWIYWQAALLKLVGTRFHPHPKHRDAAPGVALPDSSTAPPAGSSRAA